MITLKNQNLRGKKLTQLSNYKIVYNCLWLIAFIVIAIGLSDHFHPADNILILFAGCTIAILAITITNEVKENYPDYKVGEMLVKATKDYKSEFYVSSEDEDFYIVVAVGESEYLLEMKNIRAINNLKNVLVPVKFDLARKEFKSFKK